MPLKYTKSTIQRYTNPRVDIAGGKKQTCQGERLRYKHTNQSVLKANKVYNTKTQKYKGGSWHYKLIVSLFMLKNYETYNTKIRFCKGGRWRYKLIVSRGRWHYTPTVSLKYKKSTAQRYERRRKGRPWRSKSTIQRYRNFRVAAGVTNLCCP